MLNLDDMVLVPRTEMEKILGILAEDRRTFPRCRRIEKAHDYVKALLADTPPDSLVSIADVVAEIERESIAVPGSVVYVDPFKDWTE